MQWTILRERTFGKFESHSIDEFNKEASQFFAPGEDLWQYKPEGGESLIELRKRTGEFMDVSIPGIPALTCFVYHATHKRQAKVHGYLSHIFSSQLFASDLYDTFGEVDPESEERTFQQPPHVLVVAHGVLFKELMIHLAEERGVAMPCPGREYSKVSPNAGFTR